MKQLHIISVSTLLLASVLLAAAPVVAAAASTSVTGEVIDAACYIKMGAHGASHKDCAEKCADAGVPLAILEDGSNNVVWVVSSKPAQSANAELKPYVAQQVTVTGSWAERGGAKVLVIDSVKPAMGSM